MRIARIKVPTSEETAVYHCISRTVNGERLLVEDDREMFRRQMWQVAEFCGVEILTYALLSNHFHILVLVPKAGTVSDVELLRRYKILHPRPTKFQPAHPEVLGKMLATNDADGQEWRGRQLALMGDVSQFMKLLKQRFTMWYNRTHQRFGTLWAERFKSVLVENGPVLRTMAAYIDLNPVRAGLTRDPKDYRFCGYAEAVAGHKKLRVSLAAVLEQTAWTTTQQAYRRMLYGGRKKPDAAAPSAAEIEKVLKENGSLSAAELLRCRMRYFTDGAVLGSKAFVAGQLRRYRRLTGRRKSITPRPLPQIAGQPEITMLRGLRRHAIG
ncbi:MAG: transposase [Verrucomicrobiales bacterium]|jgi:REP element-mobilizing transposase RayT|nr:transposase [Verrucomicrobiales bacterium]